MRHNATQSSAIAHRLDPQVRQLLGRLPQEVTAKLSEQELIALYKALVNAQGLNSAGLRLSQPLKSKRLQCFTSVGLERRNAAAKRAMQRPSNLASLYLAMSMSLFTGLALGGIGYHFFGVGTRVVSAQEVERIHPTALPWIEEEADCKGKTRQWKNGFCYEQDHSPNF